MAIEELRMDLAAEAKAKPVVEAATPEAKGSVLKLEPNFYGIGVNLPELWRRASNAFPKRREP